jgi:hypothetical protein
MTDAVLALPSPIRNTVNLDSTVSDKVELVSKIQTSVELESRIAYPSIYENLSAPRP